MTTTEETAVKYTELILGAIEAIGDKSGASRSAIAKHIESNCSDLPEIHSALLTQHLNEMKKSGQLILAKNNYLVPDPDTPRRGRGRPPKPKDNSLPVDTVLSPPRPRGRPAKPKDPLAPPVSPRPVSGRKRGRPSKTTGESETAVAAPSDTPRKGRGRPPKATSDVVAPPSDTARKGRGRPPKAKMAEPVGV